MEIASIKGDTVLLLYHPADTAADVGQQFSVLEVPERTEGLVVQVISNDSLEYMGLQQEMIQHILEQRVTLQRPLDREQGMGEIKSLKLATAKIRKRITDGQWCNWDGWIPTRNVDVTLTDAATLLGNVMPEPHHPLHSFATFEGTPFQLDGPRLNMVNVVTGIKGSGKSHLAKHLVLALAERQVPCVIFDINGEYVGLPNAQVLQWGQNFLPRLADVGHEMLETMVRSLCPLAPGSPSESTFEARLPGFFTARRQYCERQHQPFTIDIAHLRQQSWASGNSGTFVQDAIESRLNTIENMRLFWSSTTPGGSQLSLAERYDNACQGQPIVFDMRGLGASRQRALVRSVNESLEDICNAESRPTGNPSHLPIPAMNRYPFVFFEEAHFYVSDETIINIITRGRHIGMGSVFVTNTPQKLPDTVFRQLDNLFLLSLTHKDDIRNVSKSSFTDEATIESFATRMPERHALIVGNVTDRYPLVVKVEDLPEGVPRSGRTRSMWDRFNTQSTVIPQSEEDFFSEYTGDFEVLEDPFADN